MNSQATIGLPLFQQELNINLQTTNAPGGKFVVTPDHVKWLINRLRGNGWVTSSDLGASTENEKRAVRAIAAATNGAVVSYPGSPGYKLLDECTLEELRHGDRAMRSQLREMAAKWKPIWRRMHQLELVESTS